MARSVITTDAVGCRDAVTNGITGSLCRPRDTDDLVASMEKFISLSVAERYEMGRCGRKNGTPIRRSFRYRPVCNFGFSKNFVSLVAGQRRAGSQTAARIPSNPPVNAAAASTKNGFGFVGLRDALGRPKGSAA